VTLGVQCRLFVISIALAITVPAQADLSGMSEPWTSSGTTLLNPVPVAPPVARDETQGKPVIDSGNDLHPFSPIDVDLSGQPRLTGGLWGVCNLCAAAETA